MDTLTGLRQNVVLAPMTTYHIGGPADYFIAVKTSQELTRAVIAARDAHIPVFILGTGANILIGDKGFRGLVILNQSAELQWNDTTLTAGSGATIAELIASTIEKSLSGLEHFAGIPSTLGGAVRQNLHFLNPERTTTLYIGELIAQVEVLDESNHIVTLSQEDMAFSYDDSILHHRPLVVLAATMILSPSDPSLMQAQVDANLAWRTAHQPQLSEVPSCGSVFQKIEGIGAGRLIDAAGLKGRQVGGAMVSHQHANYLVNTGHATAADVRELIALVQKTVHTNSGFWLEPEIGFIGEF